MDERQASTERNRNIWAPWRMEYIDSLGKDEQGCFLCRYRDQPGMDEQNLVLWRSDNCLAVLNRYPYTGGHAMVAPKEHVSNLEDLSPAVKLEMMSLLTDLKQVLAHAINAQGFNIGINIGRCAGAGLPEHLHMHIVPRWPGDTNFMGVFGDVHVIPTSLDEIYRQLLQAGEELNLPGNPEKPHSL